MALTTVTHSCPGLTAELIIVEPQLGQAGELADIWRDRACAKTHEQNEYQPVRPSASSARGVPAAWAHLLLLQSIEAGDAR